jgi:hypothetical protein
MEVSKKSHQLGREVSLILFTPLPNWFPPGSFPNTPSTNSCFSKPTRYVRIF